MHNKIRDWLEAKNIEPEIDIDSKKWSVIFNFKDEIITIYEDDIDSIRMETVLQLSNSSIDRELVRGIFALSYDKGVTMAEPKKTPMMYLFKYGYLVPKNIFCKKVFFEYLNSIFDCSCIFREYIHDYRIATDATVLDLSMFTTEDVDIRELNLDFLLQVRETKFGGSWEAFRAAISNDDSEKAERLVMYINKCIEFERKNNKDLLDIHEQIREELITIFEEMEGEIIYN